MSSASKVHLIDGSGYIYRAFYAIRSLSTAQGEPTNAVYGFATMIQKVLDDEKPEYVAITFDSTRHTFRQRLYPAYKAHRPPAPEDLVPQIPRIHQVAASFRLPTFSSTEYEADDIIATLTRLALEAGKEVVIVTGDKDLMQLVGPKVTIFDPMKGVHIGPKEVEEKFGVPPDRVLDALALAGDSSDNIPGVKGVGPKTATKLLQDFGTIEAVLEAAKAGRVKGKVGEKIAAAEEDALMSKKLVSLVFDVPLPDFELEQLAYSGPDLEEQRRLFTELEFKRLIPNPGAQEIPGAAPAAKVREIQHESGRVVTNLVALTELLVELEKKTRVAVEIECSSTRVVDAEVYGLAFSHEHGSATYVPVNHDFPGVPGHLDLEHVIVTLKPFFERADIEKVSSSGKALVAVLDRFDVELHGLSFDTTLASYLLDPDESAHDPATVARRLLAIEVKDRDQVLGRGQKRRSFGALSFEEASTLLGEAADVSLRAAEVLAPRLAEAGVIEVLTDVELPLIPILARMETTGVRVDLALAKKLSSEMGTEIEKLEKRCYEAAGSEFNLGSPKQLQKVLYEDLGLRIIKRTKTGPSTDASVLEELVDEHPLAQLLLDYRQLTKLKSTYLDGLSELVCPSTGRVHTTFSQATAATGRLSSHDPNLQNIPIRTETGRLLRKIFIPADGNLLISVDYSQIELRVLAHLSGEPVLIQAFRDGADIHTRTASVLFEVPPDQVTREQRTQAKAVNFGVLYGMGPVRLARQLGIPRRTASKFVEDYFARQPAVQAFIDQTLDQARAEGVVRTILGRRRIVRDIGSKNRMARAGAERIAINTPVQGSAADLIKLAMIRVAARLEHMPQAKLLLQVHDELLLEAPKREAEAVAAMVSKEMASVFPLDVPLVAEPHVGANWDEAH